MNGIAVGTDDVEVVDAVNEDSGDAADPELGGDEGTYPELAEKTGRFEEEDDTETVALVNVAGDDDDEAEAKADDDDDDVETEADALDEGAMLGDAVTVTVLVKAPAVRVVKTVVVVLAKPWTVVMT